MSGAPVDPMQWFNDLMVGVEDEYLTPLPAALPRRPYPRDTIIDPPARIILPSRVHMIREDMLTPVFGVPIPVEAIAAATLAYQDNTEVFAKSAVDALREGMMEIE